MSTKALATEVAYVRSFCKELSPAVLRTAAGLGGFHAPDRDDFDYCDLGSGMGDTTCALAAAYPRARFVGVDFNPGHVNFATEVARRGGLQNVRFLQEDFAALERQALAEFDFVCAHGVLSWIAPETQQALIDFAASHLKPGGLLYVSYNALPGWSAVQPLRRLLQDLGGTAGDPIERAKRGLELCRKLCQGGAQYFVTTPAATEMLDTMDRFGPSYTVHEYLQEHWRPMYFADVARQLAAAGLAFAGQLPLYRSMPRLTVPASLSALLEQPRDRIEAKQLEDYATNIFFHADVYVKTDRPPDSACTAAVLEETRFGSVVPLDKIRRDVRFPSQELSMPGEPFDSMLSVLCERPASLGELACLPTLAAFSRERLREALIDLLASEQIIPLAPASNHGHVADRYNRLVLQQPLSEAHPVVLASPVAGTGIAVPGLQAVCLRLLTLVEPEQRAASIRAFVERQPVKLHVGPRSVTDLEEQARIIAAELERFRTQRLPKLWSLGVVAPS